MHGIFFGVVTATGHLCLAFFVPIINLEIASSQALSGVTGNSYLSFLNITRSIFGIAFAIIAWWFISSDAADSSVQTNSALKSENPIKYGWAPDTSLWPSLLSLSICFFLYGFLSQRHYEPLNVQQLNSGYMHLGLAILSLAAGFVVTKHGIPALKKIINAALLFLVFTTVCFYFFESPLVIQVIHFLYDASNQMLFFSMTLVCGYVFLQNRNSSLMVVASLFSASAPILGVLLEKYALLRLPTIVVICVLFAGCALSAWFVRRFFPLLIAISQEADLASSQNDALASSQEATSAGPQKYTADDLKHFAARHKLNNREIQVLEMLLRGLTSLEMVDVIGLKQSTVRTYTQNLLNKTGTNSRLELVSVFLSSPNK